MAGNLKRISFTVPHDKECQAGVKDQRRKNCADGVPSKCRYYHGGSGVKDKCLLAFCVAQSQRTPSAMTGCDDEAAASH